MAVESKLYPPEMSMINSIDSYNHENGKCIVPNPPVLGNRSVKMRFRQ
jgi:hypothetical protein